MSVLARMRNIAFTEFERQAINICKESKNRLNTLPSRYKKFFNRRIYEPTNRACDAVILANEQDARVPGGAERREKLFKEAMKELWKCQIPLLSYFNLRGSSEGGMEQWVGMFNREFMLLYRVMNRKEAPPVFRILPTRKIKNLHFLGVMSELHRYTYQKIGHVPVDCADALSSRIAGFVDSALYHVVAANFKAPETQQEAKARATHLQRAIDSLNAMQRPLYALWNLMEYSERTMDEWAGLISEELKLLEGLKKADTARYKDLK